MQGRTKWRASRAASWGGNLQTEIIGNMVPVNADLHTQQNFSEKYQRLSMPSGSFASRPRPKIFLEYRFKKRQFISQPWVAMCLGPGPGIMQLSNQFIIRPTIFQPTVGHIISSFVLSAYLPRKNENYLYHHNVSTYRHQKRDKRPYLPSIIRVLLHLNPFCSPTNS